MDSIKKYLLLLLDFLSTAAMRWPRLATQHPLDCSIPLPQQDWGQNSKIKSKKSHVSRRRHFNRWRKGKITKWRIGGHSPPPTSTELPSKSLSGGHLGRQAQSSTLLHLPRVLIAEYGMQYPFGQLRAAVPALSLPNFLSTSSLHPGTRGRERNGESLSVVRAVSRNRQIISVLLILF